MINGVRRCDMLRSKRGQQQQRQQVIRISFAHQHNHALVHVDAMGGGAGRGEGDTGDASAGVGVGHLERAAGEGHVNSATSTRFRGVWGALEGTKVSPYKSPACKVQF